MSERKIFSISQPFPMTKWSDRESSNCSTAWERRDTRNILWYGVKKKCVEKQINKLEICLLGKTILKENVTSTHTVLCVYGCMYTWVYVCVWMFQSACEYVCNAFLLFLEFENKNSNTLFLNQTLSSSQKALDYVHWKWVWPKQMLAKKRNNFIWSC